MKTCSRLPKALPAPLRRVLRCFDWPRRLFAVVERLSIGFLAAGGTVFLVCLFDRFVDVDGVWRRPFPMLAGGLLAAAGFWALFAVIRRTDYDELAHRLDRRRDDHRDHLRSVVSFAARANGAGPLVEMSTARALSLWQGVNPIALIPRRRLLQLLAGAGVLTAVFVAALQYPAARAALLWQRFLEPTGNHPRPTATWFEVDAPDTLDGGDDFVLNARLAGRKVTDPRPLARIQTGDGAPILRKLTARQDGSWQLVLREVRKSFACTLVMGPVRSAKHSVHVRPRPLITEVEVTYNYPKYTRRKPETKVLTGRTLTALEGTKARIVVTANLPLEAFHARSGEDRIRFRLNSREPKQATRFHFMNRNQRLDVVLTAQNGLQSKGELPFNIRTVPDSPPTVNLTKTAEQRAFFAHEIVDIPYRARDDLGLAEVAIRAFPGSFQMEADLPSYGARNAEGVIRVPISRLVRPGLREVKLRLQAMDLKGQAALSQPITLRIAVNSYDRQLRTARNSLIGKYNSRDQFSSGFPHLVYHGKTRLKAVRSLRGKLLILSESLSAGEKAGKNQQRLVRTIRGLIYQLQPRPRYLLPSIGKRPDAITTTFDILSRSAMTPRLSRLLADTVCGGDLAVSGEKLAQRFAAALAADNPKAALARLQTDMAGVVKQQEDAAQRLKQAAEFLDLELAGYLAGVLTRDLEAADEARWNDHDFRLAATRKLKELKALLTAHKGSITGFPEAALAVVAATAGDPTPAALRALPPHLAKLNQALAATGAALAATEDQWRLSLTDYAATAGRHPHWLDVATLRLLMRMDDEGRDELDYTYQIAWLLQRRTTAATTTAAPFHNRMPAIYMTAHRFRRLADDLRIGLLTQQLQVTDPEAEMLWLRLRERRFALLRHLAAEPDDSPLHKVAAPITTGGGALDYWVMPDQPLSATTRLLEGWTTAAAAVARRPQGAANKSVVAAAKTLARHWQPLLAAALHSYRGSINTVIKQIQQVPDPGKPYAVQRAVFGPLPLLYARVKVQQLFLVQCLNLSTLCRLQTGDSPLPEDHLTALLHLLRQAEKDIFSDIGRPITNIYLGGKRDDAAMAKAAQDGKVKTYRSLATLMARIEGLTRPGTAPDDYRRELKDRVRLHHYRQDLETTRKALAQAVPVPLTRLADLKADRQGGPVLWEPFALPLAELSAAHREERDLPPPVDARLVSALDDLGDLPKGLQALPELLTQYAKSPAAVPRDELAPLLERLQELTQPLVPPAGEEVAFRRSRNVLREQVAHALQGETNDRSALRWAVAEMEWSRRKAAASEKNIGIAGLAIGADDDLVTLKLPRHLYLELKRAREQAMPELFRERCYQYLNTILEKAR